MYPITYTHSRYQKAKSKPTPTKLTTKTDFVKKFSTMSDSDSDDYSDDDRNPNNGLGDSFQPFPSFPHVPGRPPTHPFGGAPPVPREGGVFGGRQEPAFHAGHVKFGRSVDEKIAGLVDMGYSEKRVRETMMLVDNKFDDALQLLMDGKDEEMKWQDIPKELLEEPKKPPKPMTELERQNTQEQIEEIEFQTKKRKFEHDTQERAQLIQHKSDVLKEVSKIYERCKAVFSNPPEDTSPEELSNWFQTQISNELRQQHDYVQTLTQEIEFEEKTNESLKQKMKLEEIDYNDTKLAREYDKTQMQSGIRMSLEDRNIRYLKNKYEFKKTYDCEVCLGDELSVKEILVFQCGHFWCVSCVTRYIEEKIANGRVQGMKCMRPDCDYVLEHEDVRLCVSKEVLEKYDRFLVEGHLRADPDCKWCPKPDCNTAMLRNPKSPMMECPSCKYRFCFNCETDEWHSGVTCKQFQTWKIENGEADMRFGNWKRDHTKKCPKCNTDIEKNGGCDHMTCTRCHYEWYWTTGLKYP